LLGNDDIIQNRLTLFSVSLVKFNKAVDFIYGSWYILIKDSIEI